MKEERMEILSMLKEGKISVDEAERLLRALDRGAEKERDDRHAHRHSDRHSGRTRRPHRQAPFEHDGPFGPQGPFGEEGPFGEKGPFGEEGPFGPHGTFDFDSLKDLGRMFKDFGHIFGGTMKSAFSRAFPFRYMQEMCSNLDEYSPVESTSGVVPVEGRFALLIRRPVESDRRRGGVTVKAVKPSASEVGAITIDGAEDPKVYRKNDEYVIVVSGNAVISVPEKCDAVTVSLFDGDITVEGVAARTMLHTMNGDIIANSVVLERGCTTLNGNIHVELANTVGESVAITTLNGDIVLLMPSGYDGEVSAETMSGNVNFDLPDCEVRNTERRIGSGVVFTLGSGDGPRIETRTLSGDIDLETTDNRDSDERTTDESPRTDSGESDADSE